MVKRYSVLEIPSLNRRSVFFDANVLIYIFWPTGSPSWEKKYSSIFGNLLKQKNELIVDFTVISEVVNVAIRAEYQKFLQVQNITENNLRFKAFRESKEGKDALEDIFLIVRKNIINHFSVGGRIITKFDIEGFLVVDSLDFTDKLILNLCKENNFILLTNDKDFKDVDLEILTSNPVLLKK